MSLLLTYKAGDKFYIDGPCILEMIPRLTLSDGSKTEPKICFDTQSTTKVVRMKTDGYRLRRKKAKKNKKK
jgi:hypothetical protein